MTLTDTMCNTAVNVDYAMSSAIVTNLPYCSLITVHKHWHIRRKPCHTTVTVHVIYHHTTTTFSPNNKYFITG